MTPEDLDGLAAELRMLANIAAGLRDRLRAVKGGDSVVRESLEKQAAHLEACHTLSREAQETFTWHAAVLRSARKRASVLAADVADMNQLTR